MRKILSGGCMVKKEGEGTMYRIKEEFLDLWTVYDGQGGVVDLEEIKWLAKEWDKPIEELLDQVEEVEDT